MAGRYEQVNLKVMVTCIICMHTIASYIYGGLAGGLWKKLLHNVQKLPVLRGNTSRRCNPSCHR